MMAKKTEQADKAVKLQKFIATRGCVIQNRGVGLDEKPLKLGLGHTVEIHPDYVEAALAGKLDDTLLPATKANVEKIEALVEMKREHRSGRKRAK